MGIYSRLLMNMVTTGSMDGVVKAMEKARVAELEGHDEAYEDVLACGFDAAAGMGRINAIHLFLEHGCRANQKDSSALRRAVKKNRLQAAELLLTAGADARALGDAPLNDACHNGFDAMALLLLQHGANPLGRGGEIFITACENCGSEVVKAMIRDGVRPDASEWDALYSVARRLDADLFMFFVSDRMASMPESVLLRCRDIFDIAGYDDGIEMIDKILKAPSCS